MKMKRAGMAAWALAAALSFPAGVTATPVISEFMADNATTLADQDGAYSDWIEVFNPDGTAVDLAGYYLTDDLALKTKWAFPTQSLASKGSLVVFASSKNRATAGAQLHTNFQLGKNGGTVALVAPDGTTVLSVFNYPAQKEDVAYGTARQTTTSSVLDNAAPKIFVPSGGSAPAANWNQQGFVADGSWLGGNPPQGIGYDTTNPAAAPTNISGSGTASQSTTLWPYTANLANDSLTTNYTQTITADTQPFWNLAFGSDATISTITILNRADASQSRLRDITVEILNADRDPVYTSAVLNPGNTGFTHPAGPASLTVNLVTLTGGPVVGRHVRISRAPDASLAGTGGLGDDNDRYALSLAEVQVSGTIGLINLARSGSPFPVATQTSTNGSFTASLGNNGVNTDFTHTLASAGEPFPAWTINLNRKTLISTVNMHNREGCCPERLRDIFVEIFDTDPAVGGAVPVHASALLNPGNVLSGPADLLYNVAAVNGNTPVVGQWVRIKRQPDTVTTGTTADDLRVLSLGEVQVNGVELSGYRPFIRRDVQTAMLNNSPTAYLRVPFSVADPALVSGLSLRIRYDDGFVAYLNGQKVAERNAPASPDQNSTATVHRTTAEGVTAETIDLSAAISSLAAGSNNVLAIHGLNTSAADDNFLIQPELMVTQLTVSPAAFLTDATPGANNSTTWYLGDVADTNFSHKRGFYDAAFNLAISTSTPGATIYFTLDNSEPTPTNGAIYTAPITIAKTTVVRARAFKDDYKATNTDTHTYLFLSDVTSAAKGTLTTAGAASGTIPPGWPTNAATNGAQAFNFGFTSAVMAAYTPAQIKAALKQIPSISVVSQQNNLTDPATGIYVNGTNGHGEAWERPGSVELLDPNKAQTTAADGHGEFGENVGLRLRGGASRGDAYPKHSFRVFFRNAYGKGKLDYRLYGNDGAAEFETFDLRGSQNYSWSNNAGDTQETLVRDPFSRELLGAMGQPYTRSRFVHVYLNGLYWGIYEIHERPENSYGQTYIGGDKDNYDVVKNHDRYSGIAFSTEATDGYLDQLPAGYTGPRTDGNKAAWRDLWDRCLTVWNNPDPNAANANYFRIIGRNPDGSRNPSYPVLLDVDNLISYTLALFYSGDGDACLSGFLSFNQPNNWFGMRDRYGDRGFCFFNHDAEHTLKASSWSGSRAQALTDQTGPFGGSNQTNFTYSNPQWMHEELISSSEYRLRYADAIRRHFFNGGALTPTATTARWSARVNTITQAIVPYAGRWASAASAITTWNTLCIGPNGAGAIDNIPADFFTTRTTDLLNMLKNDGLYPNTAAPDFSQFGGAVPGGYQLTFTSPTAGGIVYYTTDGSDPRAIVSPIPTPLTVVAKDAAMQYRVTTTQGDGFTVIPATPVTPGPLGWWKLDGNTTDSGSGGNNGTLSNAPTYTTDRNGTANSALLLNGTSQSVQLGNPVNLQIVSPTQITLAAWIRPTASDGIRDIFNKGHNQGGTSGEVTLRINAGAIEVGTWNGTTYAASAAGAATLNTWQHVCGVFDGSAWRLYKNGVQVASFATTQGPVSVAGTTADNNNWNIGARGGSPVNGQRYFAGSIDEVQIFNRGLSAAEVQTLFTGPVTTYTPDWKALAYSVPGTWSTGAGGLGYDTDATVDFSPYIAVNLQSAMQGISPSVLTRRSFTLDAAQIANLGYLQFNIRTDDGYVAYLNGTKIAERNAPTSTATLHGQATATAVRADTDAIVQEKINITATGLPLLINGTNVLAVQGLNTTAADNDFLLESELVGAPRTAYTSGGAQQATGPVTLTDSGTVNARVYNPATGEWSAITSAFFSVGTLPASASNLVISELNYNPADATTPAEQAATTDRDDFEFVELMNITAGKIDLTGVKFSVGIIYTFGNVVLNPGQRVCLVRNEAAFRARYGAGPTVVGTYAGSLANSGERLLLQANGGATIRDFTYDDDPPWPSTSDGSGFSLVLIAPATNPDHAIAANWRPSTATNGTPGGSDALDVPTWLGGYGLGSSSTDDDGDGMNNLTEYALGTSPSAGNPFPLEATVDPSNHVTISFTHPLDRDDVRYIVQTSTNLTDWQADAILLSEVHNTADGTVTVTYRTAQPITAEQRRSVRLKIEARAP